MTVTRTFVQMRNLDKRLQREADKTYFQLLIKLAKAHQDTVPGRQLHDFLFTREKLFDEDVKELMSWADSLAGQSYSSAYEHFVSNQFALLVRKYPFPDRIFNPEKEAVRKFFKAEHSCKRINQRFRARRSRVGKPWSCEDQLNKMRSFIRYTIGDRIKLGKVYDEAGFGPGASIGVHGNATNDARKLLTSWSVTPGAYHYGYAAVMNHAQMREILFSQPGGFTSGRDDYGPSGPYASKAKLVSNNKIVFVPKTARTHRSIAVEPLLNGFLQKGVDIHLRLFLKRIGIDLSNQEINSEMARQGSLQGDDPWCTIDLSAASDSLAVEICRELLPSEWFDLLNSLRSKSFSLDGTTYTFEKFCSMGNGFCFPLETLVFTAACVACHAGRPGIDFRVYGDDIIVRRSCAEAVIKLLKYLGFNTNTEKTFLEGPFRESCGKDWFGGIDVRPFTLDYKLDNLRSLFKFLNSTRSRELTREFFEPVRPWIMSLVPQPIRFVRPYKGPEDTCIEVEYDEFMASPFAWWRKTTWSWAWRELIPVPLSDNIYDFSTQRKYPSVLVFAALRGAASSQPFTIRRMTKTKVRVTTHPGATSQWLPPPHV